MVSTLSRHRASVCVALLLFGLLVPAAALASVLSIDTKSLGTATVGSNYSVTFTASGGTPPYTWQAATWAPEDATDSGFTMISVTNGLTLTGATLSGIPIFTGIQPIIVQLTDATNATATAQFELRTTGSGSPYAFTNSPPSGAQGAPYSFTFNTPWYPADVGCVAGLKFIEGHLPPGLWLNGLNGNLVGTPQYAGLFTFTLAANPNTPLCSTEPYSTNAQTFSVSIAPSDVVSTPPGGSGWLRSGNTSVLHASSGGAWDDRAVFSPSVVKTGNASFVMYYEGVDDATKTHRIGRATSSDGVTWTKSPTTPVLSIGGSTAWDSATVRYPAVHFDGTTYRMWYHGSGHGCGIGLATSADGIVWTKVGTGPVLSCGDFGGPYAPGSVVSRNGQLVMFYWVPFSGAAIGRARSSDGGVTWTDDGFVTMTPSSSETSFQRPSVVIDGDTYRMLFTRHKGYVAAGDTGGFDIYKSGIGYATSTDGGLTWDVANDGDPDVPSSVAIFSAGPLGAWDRPGVGEPWLLKDGTTWRMWYAGGRMNIPSPGFYLFVGGQIGLATTPGEEAPPALDVSPASIVFPSTPVGATSDRTLTVRNLGGGILSGDVSTSAPFSVISGSPFSLGADESQAVVLRFAPAAGGAASGDALIASTSGNVSVTLSGVTGAMADLQMTAVTVAPTPPAATGKTVSVTSTVRNIGNAAAAGFAVRFYLSADGVLDGGDVLLGVRTVSSLAANTSSTATLALTIPANTSAPGTYQIVAIADEAHAIAELTEGNNVLASSPFSVSLYRPDLTITALTAPATGQTGRPISVLNTVRNIGPAPTVTSSTVQFYLSADGTLAGAVPIGSRSVPALPGGNLSTSVSTVTTALTIPANASAPATYQIVGVVSPPLGVPEIDADNNTAASGNVSVSLYRPDLTITALTAPTTGKTGQPISVVNTVRNIGPAPTLTGSIVRFYLSADGLLPGAVPIGSRAVPALPGGNLSTSVSTVTTVLTIPANTSAPATYQIIGVVSPPLAVPEMDAGNNTAVSGNVSVALYRPDLTITALTAPATGQTSRPISVVNTVRNIGPAPTLTGSIVRFYLSADGLLPGAVPIGSRAVPALPGGNLSTSVSTVTTVLTIPANTSAPATYQIIGVVSPPLGVPEMDAGNNTAVSGSVSVSLYRPDLTITALTAPATGQTSRPISVLNTVRNIGPAPTLTSSTVQFFLSADGTLAGAVPIGSRSVPALPGGNLSTSVSTVTTALTIPANTSAPATYQIVGVVSPPVGVLEMDAGNNTAVSGNVSVALYRPDLTITALTAPTTGKTGQPISVLNTVRNIGPAPTLTGSIVRFYLSADGLLPGAVPIGSRAVPALPGGNLSTSVSTVTTALTIPANTSAPATYQIIGVVSPPPGVLELGGDNNAAVSGPIDIAVFLPDLAVTAVAPTLSSIGTGQVLNVSNTVRNVGMTSTPATTVRFYLSADGALDLGDVLLGVRPVPALPGGNVSTSVSTALTPLTVPANTSAPATYQVIALVDPADGIVELDADNNVLASAPFGVTLFRPDLRMDLVQAPPVFIKGVAALVRNSVTNIGPAAAGPFTVRLYLFAGDTFDLAQAVLVTSRSVASLAAGAVSDVSTSVTFPQEIESDVPLHFAAIADFENSVTELIEYADPGTNNLAVAGNPTVVGPSLLGTLTMQGIMGLQDQPGFACTDASSQLVSGNQSFTGTLGISAQRALANGIGFTGAFALTGTPDGGVTPHLSMSTSNGLLMPDGSLSGNVSVSISGPFTVSGTGSFVGQLADGVTLIFTGQTTGTPHCVLSGTLTGMPLTKFDFGYMLFSQAGGWGDDNGGTAGVSFPKAVQQYASRFSVDNDPSTPDPALVKFKGPAGSGVPAQVAADPSNSHHDSTSGFYESPVLTLVPGTAPVAGGWLVEYKGANKSVTAFAPAAPLAVPVPTITLNDDGSLASIDWIFRNGATGAPIAVPAYVTRQQVQLDGTNGRVYDSLNLVPAATSQAFEVGAMPWACVASLHMTYNDVNRNHYVVSYSKTPTGTCPNLTGGGGQPMLQLAFNFEQGSFNGGTTGVLPFPSPVAYYFVNFNSPFAGTPPASVFFTGPLGSGLDHSESVTFQQHDGSAGYTSAARTETPPGGTWTVAYGANQSMTFDLPAPQSDSRGRIVVPTVTLSGGDTGTLQSVSWQYLFPDGTVSGAETFMSSIELRVEGCPGGCGANSSVVRLYETQNISPLVTQHTLGQVVNWSDVTQIQMVIHDDVGNDYTSYWNNGVLPAPTLTDFSPLSGPVGTTVTVNGTHFGSNGSVGGINQVRFRGPGGDGLSGVAASFTILSETQLTATVPSGAISGPIWIQSVAGSATSIDTFTVSP